MHNKRRMVLSLKTDEYLRYVAHEVLKQTGVPPTDIRRVDNQVLVTHRGRTRIGGCCAPIIEKVVPRAR